jgi:predicted  nucleic acid-binding Zn-ribbon protein
MIPVLIESALRALLVALTVWAGLRLFRVSNVPAQKAAWSLVLACAVAMPLLMRWQILPDSMAFKVPAALRHFSPGSLPLREALLLSARAEGLAAVPETALLAVSESNAGGQSPAPVLLSDAIDSPAPAGPAKPARYAAPPARVRASQASQVQTVRAETSQAEANAVQTPTTQLQLVPPQPEEGTLLRWIGEGLSALSLPSLGASALFLYLAVCGVLLSRLAYGLNRAIELWFAAEVFVPYPQDDPGYGLRMRFSRKVSSPVTMGSGVLLPYECLEWDAEKLRIVLAHERAHIRQGDFYLQLLAGVYSAIFWPSPLGWWLKRTLCDLGETISDYAGLEAATSRASYAQLLLEFAALPRPTAIGVAMARSTNLSNRIERLLNESSFHLAFAGTRLRLLLAVVLVPVALLVGTAMIRVEASASAQETPPAPAVPSAAPVPTLAPAAVAPAPAPNAIEAGVPPEPAMAPAPASLPAPPAAAPESDMVAPAAPAAAPAPAAVPPMPPVPATYARVYASSGDSYVAMANGQQDSDTTTNVNVNGKHKSTSTGKGYSYSFSSDGDSWALITDSSQRVRFSGDWHDSTRESIEKARKLSNGKFLWFTRDGKSYFIDDEAVLGQIEAMQRPIDELGRQQEVLGKQQEELGRRQEELGKKQEEASIPTPDISKEMAELNEAVARLNAKKGGTVNQEQIADIEGKIGDIQGKLGELQGEVGEQQGKLGEEQGKLGEQQGKLGEEQGRLGEQQGRLSEEADHKVQSIINESLRNGKARPVE